MFAFRFILFWCIDYINYHTIRSTHVDSNANFIIIKLSVWVNFSLNSFFFLHLKLERHAKGIMFSGVGLASAFDWDSERINYESVRKNFNELELVERLRLETIHCDKCGHRLIIDCKIDGIVYCTCSTANTCASRAVQSSSSSGAANGTGTGTAASTSKAGKQCETYEKPWQPYLERESIIIWRREEQPGLFAYKGML